VGNTLCHNDHDWIASHLRAQGMAMDPLQVEKAEGPARQHIAPLIAARSPHVDLWEIYFSALFRGLGVAEARIPQLVRDCWERHDEVGLFRSVRAGTPETLAELKGRGYRVGVVSNAEGNIPGLMDQVGLTPLLDVIIDSGIVGVEKPDPAIWNLALEPLALQPAEAAHVGDILEVDVQGAAKAGLTPILFDPLGLYPTAQVRRLEAIPGILEMLPKRG
jgi:HAD superfamily hydrolase (TIGR01549 family)